MECELNSTAVDFFFICVLADILYFVSVITVALISGLAAIVLILLIAIVVGFVCFRR